LAVTELNSAGEATVGGEGEVGGWLLADGGRAKAEVVCKRGNIDHFTGVEQALRIESEFKVTEGLDEAGAEHALHEDAAEDAVTMLTAEAAVEFDHEVGDRFSEALHRVELTGIFDISVWTNVEAADAGVAVVGGGEAVLLHERVETGDEGGQAGRVYGGVLDEGERLGVAADAHKDAETCLAHTPHAKLLVRVEGGDSRIAEAFTIEGGGESRELVAELSIGVSVELNKEEGARVTLDELNERGVAGAPAAAVDDGAVDELDGGRRVLVGDNGRFGGFDDGAEMDGGEALARGDGGEAHGRFGDEGEGALRSDDEGNKVGRVV
jgi:hypothetical protein